MKQQEFELVITSEKISSTDERFDINKLTLGDNYVSLSVYFERADGEIIKRNLKKWEQKISNKTMPLLACQIFEKQLAALSVEEKEAFPICKYTSNTEMVRGIYTSVPKNKDGQDKIGVVVYEYDDDRKFAFYYWNIFSTLQFVQECLKRFGNDGDRFVLKYREKNEKEKSAEKKPTAPEIVVPDKTGDGYKNEFSYLLLASKNIIFRGAPGTGKSHLAKEIAADIISKGYYDDCSLLSDEQKQQVEFVQFHPSYDYSDFVEGLRPKLNADGTMGFELQDGIFKRFIERAKKNYENAQKPEQIKKYVFIIDEINRGEISKILGELFFAIDPGYRGKAGEVSTQYANLHADPNEKFYIPENVYIIGTMNDIDRSVDTFDFAMRRRFRFIELKANDMLEMLEDLEDEEIRAEAIRRMTALNNEIAATDGLNENYQIGASYFLKLKALSFDQLWTDHLQPLLQEYITGMYDEKSVMLRFAKAYGYSAQNADDEAAQN